MTRFAVGPRADAPASALDRRGLRAGRRSPDPERADRDDAGAAVAPAEPAGASFPEAYALAARTTAPTGERDRADEPPHAPGAPAASASLAADAPGAADGRPAPGDAAGGCPVFLAGVPIDAAGARWLTATARAARAGDADARLALWLALRPRFARWAAACLDRTNAADLRRDGAPWLLDDLLQEGYLVLLGVVADWPDGDDPASAMPAAQPTADAAGGGGPDPATPDIVPTAPVIPPGDRAFGIAPATDDAFPPWLFAVAPRRLYGALASLRDRAGRGRGPGHGVVPLSDADLLADGTAEAAEAAARLAAIAAALDPIDGALLLAHVADREPIVLAGRRLGLDRGAAYHRWRRVRARLREGLTA